MKAGVSAAGLGLFLLNACAADVVSVGAWVEGKPSSRPTLDAAPEPALDATQESTLDASQDPTLDATSDPALDVTPAPTLEPAGPYIEAELGELSAGFEINADENASGGKFLTALESSKASGVPGDARARYLLDVLADGEYVVWGRIHGPDAEHNRFWFQIDGGPWYLWRMSTGEIWFWDDLHNDTSYRRPLRFTLTQGVHELMLANDTSGVHLDRLYFTAAGDEPPGNNTPCRPPDSIEVSGQCLPSCGSLRGTACGAELCGGAAALLESYDCKICCRL